MDMHIKSSLPASLFPTRHPQILPSDWRSSHWMLSRKAQLKLS
jgi:hypothetical protein